MVEGLTELDLNDPDHVAEAVAAGKMARECGLSDSGPAMRNYTSPAFKRGAFTNPDQVVRRETIDLTKRGIDAAPVMGGPMMTLWLGQDGYDYAFQCDYPRPVGRRDIRDCRSRGPRSGLHDLHRI